MKTYLLLRNNKQTGPHSFEEMLSLVPRPQDLIWVEGKSGSWRYPSELDEFKAHLPVSPEISGDISFTQAQNEVLFIRNSQLNEPPPVPLEDDELAEFPTLALFFKNETPEPRIEAAPRLEHLSEQPPGKDPQPIITQQPKIVVSLPAAKADKTTVVIQRKDLPKETKTAAPETIKVEPQTAEKVEHLTVTKPAPPMVAKVEIPAIVEVNNPKVESVEAFEMMLPVAVEIQRKADFPVQPGISSALPPSMKYDPAAVLQKLAVAAAVTSLVAVGGLIAYAVWSPDAYDYGTGKFPKSASAPAKSTKAIPANKPDTAAQTAQSNR